MGIFKEWVERRLDETWARSPDPTWKPDAMIGGDPVRSALEKLERGQAKGLRGVTQSDILARHLGMGEEEYNAVMKLGLLQKSPDGWNVDMQRLPKVYQQITGMPLKAHQPTEDLGMKMLSNVPPPPPRKQTGPASPMVRQPGYAPPPPPPRRKTV